MKDKIPQSQLALDAMRRASRKAVERAAEKNLKIPIWENGRIAFVNAKELDNVTLEHGDTMTL